MLVLQKNTSNEIALSLFDSQIGSGSLFLFEFIHVETNTGSYCLAQNSSSTTRFSQFFLLETGSNNQYNAQIFFPYEGQYQYNVYEAISSSLSPIGLNVFSLGKVLVTGSGFIIPAYTGSTSIYGAYDSSQYQ